MENTDTYFSHTLQYDFLCNQKEGVQRINIAQQVADGNEHVVLLR